MREYYIRKDGINSGIEILDILTLDPRQIEKYKYGKLIDEYDTRLRKTGCPFPGEDGRAMLKAIPYQQEEYCTYYWITENDNSYVGMTNYAPARMHEHVMHQVKYWDMIRNIDIYKVIDKTESLKLERLLIYELKPTLNGQRHRMTNYLYYQTHPVPKPDDMDEIFARLGLEYPLHTVRIE